MVVSERLKPFQEFLQRPETQLIIGIVKDKLGDFLSKNNYLTVKVARKLVFKLLHIPENLHIVFFDVELAREADKLLEEAIKEHL